MRRFRFLIAVMAWLLQGLMPALAWPMPQDAPMAHSMVHEIATDTMPPMDHAAMGHGAPMLTKAMPGLTTGATHHACPDCDKQPKTMMTCMMGLCAACTVLVPELVFQSGQPVGIRYPMPLPAAALLAGRPAPLDPPPRA
jgi:hypothetical protein